MIRKTMLCNAFLECSEICRGCHNRGSGTFQYRHVLVVVAVVVDDDSHIFQRMVLATKETMVTEQVSLGMSKANPARGHKGVRRSTGHIMMTTRYSNQKLSKSRQIFLLARPNLPRTSETF